MKEVLQAIKPQKEEIEHFTQATQRFISTLNKALPDAKVILGGSGAKGTWLSGNHDVDIFVAFAYKKYKEKSAQLSEILQKALRKAFPKITIDRVHGSRDYFQLEFVQLHIEVVPILDITSAKDAINITDVSPLHTRWVNTHGKKCKDEILLAKQFCRAQGFYGAESYISGFSGYVLEILVIHYGSFEALLSAALRWKSGMIIDVENHYQAKDALFHLNKSKLQSPLIVIDPVDPARNAAAALSLEKFTLFKKHAREYLNKPATQFFTKKEISVDELAAIARRKKQHLAYVVLRPQSGKKDVVGGKLVKVYTLISREIDVFDLKKSGWEWQGNDNDAIFYFFVAKNKRPENKIRQGPPLRLSAAVKSFRQKNKETFVEADRMMARIPVKYPLLKDLLTSLLARQYVTERISQVVEVVVF